jgi:hypothetical protein
MSVVAFPTGYWISVVELSTYGTADNTFSLSFGQVRFHTRNVNKKADVFQVFALFVAVPPVIQVVQLTGELWYWFRGITWVQRIAGTPTKRHSKVKNPPIGLPDLVPKENRSQREELYSDN